MTRDLDLWPFDRKITGFPGLIVEHFCVKFGDFSCIRFRDIVRKNRLIDKVNGGKNPNRRLRSAWVIMTQLAANIFRSLFPLFPYIIHWLYYIRFERMRLKSLRKVYTWQASLRYPFYRIDFSRRVTQIMLLLYADQKQHTSENTCNNAAKCNRLGLCYISTTLHFPFEI